MPAPPVHHWYGPAEIAALLDATPHGTHWRAACPAHGGGNRQALAIREGRDAAGHPMTLLHCFAHECTVADICAALGIDVRQLFCLEPAYSKATRHTPRAKSPGIARLKQQTVPATPDEMALIMLEEMIVSDPAFIQECAPARAKMWELAQASPLARETFTKALREAQIPTAHFWAQLASEQKGEGYVVDE